METLDISSVPDYDVGGCIHVVVNNQVAFTTDSKQVRQSPFATSLLPQSPWHLLPLPSVIPHACPPL